ncbi:hypothetical protein CEXT_758271 [Caerostris extrusa]|uniref:Uncharacterized protein n=1 Tax=Caerostris extrusa TaxID=172846 RepID=A0AAV4PLX2_CAEEX|nr:hypothetical protein CEXT_758271 [Caerostris extrusa]
MRSLNLAGFRDYLGIQMCIGCGRIQSASRRLIQGDSTVELTSSPSFAYSTSNKLEAVKNLFFHRFQSHQEMSPTVFTRNLFPVLYYPTGSFSRWLQHGSRKYLKSGILELGNQKIALFKPCRISRLFGGFRYVLDKGRSSLPPGD